MLLLWLLVCPIKEACVLATFGQRCGMCVQNICALCSLLVHMGAKLWPWPVSQAAADSQGYQVLVCHPVCRLGSFPVRWYIQNDHRCALVRTVTLLVQLLPTLWGGQHWEKLLWTLAVEEVHTVCIFTGDKAPGGCGRVKFSLLITYFFDVPRKQVSVCQCETKCWLKLWCYTRCTLCSLDSIIFTIVEKHFLPQVFLWWQENLFLLLSTGHLSKKSSGNWTLKLNPMRAAYVFNVYWLLFVWSKISEQNTINNTFIMYLSIGWEKHMLTRVRVSFVI